MWGKCWFEHNNFTGKTFAGNRSQAGMQYNNERRENGLCRYNEQCRRKVCSFKHIAVWDFPNLKSNQFQAKN